jgi:AcrR family transcriptional regulator
MLEKLPSSPLRVSPQPRPKITKAERTRAAILNAGLDFIWTRPFREMTVNSLMVQTGLSRSAFYQHFGDLHDLMEALLTMLQQEIFAAAEPWLERVGDPVALTCETLAGLVHVCFEQGPFLRAITDAAADDSRLEMAWLNFLGGFDDAACARIEADQEQGLIPDFDARPVAFALNRLDAYSLLQSFGQHPRSQPEPVQEALARIWISTLYGAEWLGSDSSNLVRT